PALEMGCLAADGRAGRTAHPAERGSAETEDGQEGRGPRASRLAHGERDGEGERVGVVVMAARRMVHQRLAPGAGTALQELQFAAELWMVEQRDVPLGEEGLDLQIGEALVEVARGLRIARGSQLRLQVAEARSPEALAHPGRGVAVADD